MMDNIESDLWQFPCDFMFKAMAYSDRQAENEIISVINQYVPGDYTPQLKPSRKGNYVSVSICFTATSKQQLNEIYLAVNALECVKFCL